MSKKSYRIQRKALKKQLADLHEEYVAASRQLSRTLSEPDRIRIRRQIKYLKQEIKRVKVELHKVTRSDCYALIILMLLICIIYMICNGSQPTPKKAVEDYYHLINQRQYEEAWARLSDGFKQQVFGNDHNIYVTELNKVEYVQVSGVTLEVQSETEATVNAQFRYLRKNVPPEEHTARIQLKLDTQSDAWLIDSYTPISSQ